MSNLPSFIVATLIAFALGAVVGETYAPISGATTQALSRRCAEIETRVAELEARVARVEAAARAWAAESHAPWLVPAEDGGTKILRAE